VSLSLTLARDEKVEHYIRIKTHQPIALRFWIESSVNALCGWVQVSQLMVERGITKIVLVEQKGSSNKTNN